MDRNRNRNRNSVILVLLLLILIVAQGSDASLLSKIRKLVAATSPEVNRTQISPSPAPITATIPSLDNSNSVKHKKKPPVAKNNPPEIDPKGPHVKPSDTPHNDTEIEKVTSQDVTDKKCVLPGNSCTKGDMIACLMPSKEGPRDLLILIQNEGESVLNVSVTVPASVEVLTKELEIPKHRAKKINASTNVGESHKIVLNAGYGDCVLQTGVPIAEDNFFQRIPYAEHVTPMHGAYVTFVVALIVGGTWACCKFGKREQHGSGGVPYQELEMALPESVPAGNGDAENGWDQGWDDDWDEEKAVKSPGKRVVNPSTNGHTSTSLNKENGWENDWDD